jgi:hypothetical protein
VSLCVRRTEIAESESFVLRKRLLLVPREQDGVWRVFQTCQGSFMSASIRLTHITFGVPSLEETIEFFSSFF